MQYVLVIGEAPERIDGRGQPSNDSYLAAWRAYHRALVGAGVYVGGAPLGAIATATTVRVRDGKALVQDGPFAEAKEQLGGFIVLELDSLDAALEWAKRCPAALAGAIEVRPFDHALHDAVVDGSA